MRLLLGIFYLCFVCTACASQPPLELARINEQIHGTQSVVEKSATGIKFDFSMKKNLIEAFKQAGVTAERSEYRNIHLLFGQLESIQQRLIRSAEVVQFYLMAYEMAVGGRSSVDRSDHAILTIQQVKVDLPQWSEKIKKEALKYRNASEAFGNAIVQAQVGQVNSLALENEVTESLVMIRRQTFLSLENIAAVKKRLGSRELNRQPMVQDRLDQLKEILAGISLWSDKAESSLEEFIQHAGDQKVFIVAPHMPVHRHLLHLQESMTKIQELAAQYNLVIQQAWNLRKQAQK